ncbi:MAG: acyltransferase [Desulfobacteraceae bacterium]|jgi:1-acyl-sn-glycerol-3-phosphate acyltransferase
MFRTFPAPVRGCISLLGYALNSFFWFPVILFIALLRALVPLKAWQRWCGRLANGAAENWICVNHINQKLTGKTRIEVQGLDDLKRSEWYLVLANHQSWVDILVLQRIFNRRIPFLKFFIKKQLFWFPVLGQAWWALDFPFVKRYKASLLKKKPHLKGKDIEITKKACKKFKTLPVSVMNFVEGTRFTETKRRRQQSPYTNLLKTKAGGIASVLAAMGEQIDRVLDVTIVYPQGGRSFWSFLCGNIKEIKVRVKALPVSHEQLGDYANDRNFRKKFQDWLNTIWEEKDHNINGMLNSE